MNKRGQDGGVFTYVLIAVIVLLILFVGHKAIKGISEATCRSGSAAFGTDVKFLGEGLSFGDVRLKELSVPCGAEEVYFVDTTRDVDGLLKSSPLIQDSLKDDTGVSVFLTKKSDVEGSFDGGRIEIGYPYYLCMKPRQGRASVFVKGLGDKVLLTQGCSMVDCTEIPATPNDGEARSIIDSFVDFGYSGECDNCPADTKTEYENYQDSRDDVEIYRRYTYCSTTGLTRVEIIIRPKGKSMENFYLYESIPKECVSSLKESLESVEGDVTIKDDPLMMWHFNQLKEDTSISYTLKKELSDHCKRIINGLGIERIKEGVREKCKSRASFACYDGDVYWQNSCGVREELKEQCQSGCSATKCNPVNVPKQEPEEPPADDNPGPEPPKQEPPACSDECNSQGEKQCNGYYAQTCYKKTDGCLVWNTGIKCEYGCSGGECSSCTETSWSPSSDTVCNGETFTQTSNCDTTRQTTGTKDCAPKIEI